MTRNTRKWIGGLISALASGAIAVLGIAQLDPADFNTDNLGRLFAVAGIAAVIGVVNYLVTHPLPDDGDSTIDPGPLAVWLLPLLVAGTFLASCATVTRHPGDPEIQQVRAKALEIAKAVENAGELVVQVGRAAVAANDAGLLPRDARDAILQGIIDLEPKAIAAIDAAKTVTTHPQLRTTVTALMDVMTPLIQRLVDSGSPELVRLGGLIRTAYAVARIYLEGASAPVPVMTLAVGGAR